MLPFFFFWLLGIGSPMVIEEELERKRVCEFDETGVGHFGNERVKF